MSFTQEYQKKLTTADEAVKVVKSGDRLEYGWCVTTPVALDEALAKRMPDLENIQIHGGIVMRPLAITQIENPADHFTWNSWHMGGLVHYSGSDHNTLCDERKSRPASCL